MNTISSLHGPIRTAALTAVLSLLALAGCRSGDRELTARQDALLAAVPAASPYLLTALEPFPTDFRALLNEKLLPALTAQLPAGPDAVSVTVEQGLFTFYQMLATIYDPQRAKAAGLDDEMLWALYGAPVLPVFRHEVSDAGRAETWILEQFRNAGAAPAAVQVGGAAAYKLPLGGAALYFRFTERHAVYALLPDQDDSPALGLALALSSPPRALDAAALRAKAEKDGQPLYEFGYLQPPELVSGLLAADGPFTAEIAADPELAAFTAPPCRNELGELMGLVPRLDFVLKSADRRQMTMVSESTLRPDLAADFGKISGGIPELEFGAAPFAMGLSLRLGALREMLLRLARDTVADPWVCPQFAELNSTAEQILTAANTPIPPAVGNLHGISLTLDRLPSDLSAITDFAGRLTIYIDHPALLYGMAQMFIPALAAIELSAGGEPVALPATLTGLDNPPVFAAMSDSALGLARGGAALAALPSRLGPLPAGGRTLVAYDFEYGLLDSVMNQAMSDFATRAAAEADCAPDCPADETVAEQQQAVLDKMRGFLALLDREHLVVQAGERGLAVETVVTFATD